MVAMAGVITSAAFASVLAGCGASDAPTTGTESDELSSASAAAPANTIMKITPPNVIMKVNPTGPTAASGNRPSASAAADGKCGAGEKICQLANDKGICVDRCVADDVMCVAPTCVVCDPAGPPPEGGCKWDSEACEWLCI